MSKRRLLTKLTFDELVELNEAFEKYTQSVNDKYSVDVVVGIISGSIWYKALVFRSGNLEEVLSGRDLIEITNVVYAYLGGATL